MSWQDRVKPAAYESPSGRRIEFLFENVAESFGKKTTAFEFPDVDGTFVQDLGRTGNRLPLRIIINGDDIRLTPEALLRVDGLLNYFFEPEFQDIRYT